MMSIGLAIAALAGAAWSSLTGASAAAPEHVDAGTVTCVTNSAGYCTITHALGVVPTAIIASVNLPNSGAVIASQINTDQFTANSFRVRVGTPTGAAFAS